MEADSLQGALADAATARNMTAREQEKVLRSGAKFRELLIANSDRLLRIFKEWDENGDGQISVKEFRRALPMLRPIGNQNLFRRFTWQSFYSYFRASVPPSARLRNLELSVVSFHGA